MTSCSESYRSSGLGREIVSDERLVKGEVLPVCHQKQPVRKTNRAPECIEVIASKWRVACVLTDDVEVSAEARLDLAAVQQTEELGDLMRLLLHHKLQRQLRSPCAIARPVRQQVGRRQSVLEDRRMRASVGHSRDGERVFVDVAEVLEVAVLVGLKRLPCCDKMR